MPTNNKQLSVEKEVHLLMAHKDDAIAIRKILAGHTLSMLAKIAEQLDYWNFIGHKYSKFDFDNMLQKVLRERKKRLNADFQWTDQNKAGLRLVSDRLYEAYEKGWLEAQETAAALEKRIKRRDSFLKDYEIKITVYAYPKIGNETIAAYLGEKTLFINASISHYHYGSFIKYKDELSMDKSKNWNSEYFNGEFDNDYISYPIHFMLGTQVWSFTDILSIGNIWVNVEVTHQYNLNTKEKRYESGRKATEHTK